MFWNKKLLSLFIAIFLLVPIVYGAEQFYAEIKPINEKIYEDEAASFYLRIINNLEVQDTYRIYTLDYPMWSIYSAPGEYSISATVGKKTDDTIMVFVEPISATPGIYDVNIKIRSQRTDKVINVPATVTLRHPSGTKEYIPTVLMDVTVSKDINPKEPIPLKIDLINQNPLNIPELEIKIVSESGLIQKIVNPGIQPKEKKTVEITEQLDPTTPPQPDILYFSLLRGNETITGPVKKNIEIIEYSDITPDIKPTKGLLKTDNIIIFTNDGNVKHEGNVKVGTSFLQNMFTSTDPAATSLKEEGRRYLSWPVSLEPGESYQVRVVINYRPLLLIAILLAITIALYFQFRSPLIIRKSVADVHKHEGGISGVKVILNITNRGKKPVKDVELSDKVPDLVEVEPELTIGSLQPDKVLKHEKKGMLLKWSIRELEPEEERVITYRVRAKLSILGEFVLPPMWAKFSYMGREVKSNSNRLYVNS
ncbi:hypothetical protein KY360_05185 [Candidatus Woesearchaeota archaeon]|nr:hypothetical protein [Candidatus Woesearchaeota archaeon]